MILSSRRSVSCCIPVVRQRYEIALLSCRTSSGMASILSCHQARAQVQKARSNSVSGSTLIFMDFISVSEVLPDQATCCSPSSPSVVEMSRFLVLLLFWNVCTHILLQVSVLCRSPRTRIRLPKTSHTRRHCTETATAFRLLILVLLSFRSGSLFYLSPRQLARLEFSRLPSAIYSVLCIVNRPKRRNPKAVYVDTVISTSFFLVDCAKSIHYKEFPVIINHCFLFCRFRRPSPPIVSRR